MDDDLTDLIDHLEAHSATGRELAPILREIEVRLEMLEGHTGRLEKDVQPAYAPLPRGAAQETQDLLSLIEEPDPTAKL